MKSLGCTAVLVLWVTVAVAQPMPQGEDFQLNTLTPGYQDGVDIGVAADDEFVVVWHSPVSAGTDTDSNSVQARLYAGDGTPQGVEFQVNTYTTNFQGWPALAVASTGEFVVVWTSYQAAADSDGGSIQGQRFNADGSPAGGQFQVNSYTTNEQQWPDVAMDSEGKFVVVWHSLYDTTGSDSLIWSIQGQRFAADGLPQGGQFQVNSYSTNDQTYPNVSVNGAGDFVVVWQSYGSAGTDAEFWSVQGQRFASNGAPQGSEFQVNTRTTGYQYKPDVALNAAGDFVVVWQDNDYHGSGDGVDGEGSGIVARRYTAAGAPLGPEFVVNTYTSSMQSYASVAFDSTDRFVVTWTSDGSFGSDDSLESIQGRQYEANGMSIGPEFQVNSHIPQTQYNSKLGFGSEGKFVVAWASYSSEGTDNSGTSSQARQFLAETIFADGFESGDTSAWSSVVD